MGDVLESAGHGLVYGGIRVLWLLYQVTTNLVAYNNTIYYLIVP